MNAILNNCLAFNSLIEFIDSLFNEDVKYGNDIIYISMSIGIYKITNPKK